MSDHRLDDMQPSYLLEPNYEEMIEGEEKAKPTELLPPPEQFDLPAVIVEEPEKKPMQSLIKGPEEFGNFQFFYEQMPEAMMEVKEEAKQQAEDVQDDVPPVAEFEAFSIEDTPTIEVPGPSKLLPVPKGIDLPVVIVEEPDQKPMQRPRQGLEIALDLSFLFDQFPEAKFEIMEIAKKQTEEFWDDKPLDGGFEPFSIDNNLLITKEPGPDFDVSSPNMIVEDSDQNPMQGPRQGLDTALSEAELEIKEVAKQQTEEFWDNLPLNVDSEPFSIDDVLPVTKEPRPNELLLPPGEFNVPSPNMNDEEFCRNPTSSPNKWVELNFDENAQRELEKTLFEKFMEKLSKGFKDETEELPVNENEMESEED